MGLEILHNKTVNSGLSEVRECRTRTTKRSPLCIIFGRKELATVVPFEPSPCRISSSCLLVHFDSSSSRTSFAIQFEMLFSILFAIIRFFFPKYQTLDRQNTRGFEKNTHIYCLLQICFSLHAFLPFLWILFVCFFSYRNLFHPGIQSPIQSVCIDWLLIATGVTYQGFAF